jgi:hypothetical protein
MAGEPREPTPETNVRNAMSSDTPSGRPDNDHDETPDAPRAGTEAWTEPETDAVATPDDSAADDSAADDATQRLDAPYDETPTERFDPIIDETPTDRFQTQPGDVDAATRILPTSARPVPPAQVPPAYSAPGYLAPAAPTQRLSPPAAASGAGLPPQKKNRTALYWLIGIGAVLLVALIALLIWLSANPSDQTAPTAAPTPTATPTAEPTPTPTEEPEPTQEPEPEPTQAPAPVGPTFATFTAPPSAGCEEGDDEAPLTFSWSSTDAVTAYLGVGTQNAATNPTVSDLPPTATYSDLAYDCSVASQVYTVTLEDELGSLASKTVTITR